MLTELSSVDRGDAVSGIVYDVTSRSSFENLQTWLSECENYCTDQADNIVKLLVANKIDLVSSLVARNP